MSTTTFETMVAREAAAGPARHARWDAHLFEAYAAGPARWVLESVGSAPDAATVLCSYLALVREAVGAGYVTRVPIDRKLLRYYPDFEWASVIELGLCHLLPNALAAVPGGRHLDALALVWNVAEGLQQQPRWLDRHVARRIRALESLDGFVDEVTRAVEDVLGPARPSSWAGPFASTILSTRDLAADFLPGAMHLAAPSVVCVHDRRREGVQVQLVYQRGGLSAVSGPYPCPGDHAISGDTPEAVWSPGELRIGAHRVALPTLVELKSMLVAAPGFAVVSARDSQRLWIVESET
jgi:hypothetical protein